MTESYAFWRDCLAAKQAGQSLPVGNVDDPQAGFWRTKRGTSWVPVAVWPKGNGLQGPDALGFKIGTEVVGANMGTELWSHYCAHPITEAEYRKVAEQGGDWSDSDPTVTAMAADHAAPDADPVTAFRQKVDTALAGLAPYTKIESDDGSARAAGLRNLFLKLKKDADDARAAEKKPHLDAGKAVDEKWRGVIAEAERGANSLRKGIEGWEDDKRRAQASASAAAQAASEAAGEPVQPRSNLPPPSSGQIRPTHGKAASVGTYQHVLKIDPDKVLAALRERPEWYSVLNCLEEIASKLARNGIILPGVETEERAKVR